MVEADGAVDGDVAGDAVVVVFDRAHDDHERGDEDGGDPCAFSEFGDEDYEEGGSGGGGSDAVDDHAAGGTGAAQALPVHDHSGLGEGEGQEGADGEEGDEAVGDSAEDDQKEGREADESGDSVRVEETAAADFEDVGKIVALGDGSGEAGEVGVGGVGGESEDRRMEAMVT